MADKDTVHLPDFERRSFQPTNPNRMVHPVRQRAHLMVWKLANADVDAYWSIPGNRFRSSTHDELIGIRHLNQGQEAKSP